ncbi:NAD(P)-binding protein [Hypomontagnella submonticulosa]|nr:NAD(P)-binding protein [Hypomontagnella submonticulosa]
MSQNILITGAAGYIGGSLLAELISHPSGPVKATKITAAVRSEDQVRSLSKLGVNVVRVDLNDETAVKEAVLRNDIDIVVHTASSTNPRLASHLIKALGQRRKDSEKEVYFIHSSVATVFSEEAGWPPGEVKDSDPIFEKEKQLGGSHPVRETDILVTEESRAHGVQSLIVPIPIVYGRGTGEWRKLSVNIPAFVRTSIAHKVVYKFDKDGSPPALHISDLTALYSLLLEKILQKESIPMGEQGYYFAIVHRVPWWDVMQRIAEVLYASGLVTEPKPQVWPSDDMAADYLGFPRAHIRAMGTFSGQLVPVNAYKLGWQPKWDQEKFLASIDDEVQAVRELDSVKPTVFEAILAPSKD